MKQNDKPKPTPPEVPCEYIRDAYPPNLKYPPKEPKRDKFDIIYNIGLNLLIIMLLFHVAFLISGIFYKQIRIQKEAITIDCKLLNRDFGSLSEFRTKYIVNFDCGNYGILISHDKEIFRQAKETNKIGTLGLFVS